MAKETSENMIKEIHSIHYPLYVRAGQWLRRFFPTFLVSCAKRVHGVN